MSSIRPIGACPKKTTENHKLSKDVAEKTIQKQVESFLNSLGIVFIRIPTGIYKSAKFGQYHNKGEQIQALKAIKGVPDITILLHDGRYICVELKKNGGKQSLGQKQFERSVGSDNYYLCYSLEDVKRLLIKYKVLC